MDLLANAIQSIKLGVEDFENGKPERATSATRNIYAGLLLLYKEKLRRLSPAGSEECLVKVRILPTLDANGVVRFVGRGKRTVDVQLLKDRLESLGVSVDWKQVKQIGDIRNDIEHYHPKHPEARVREVISTAFVLIRDFLTLHLKEEPALELGETWDTMLKTQEVYDREHEACVAALSQLTVATDALSEALQEARCSDCKSELVAPANSTNADEGFVCRVCATETGLQEMAEHCLDAVFWRDAYEAGKDGEEPPVGTCPECLADTFLVWEDLCALCGETRAYKSCIRCDCALGLDEQDDGGLCSYCYHVSTKD